MAWWCKTQKAHKGGYVSQRSFLYKQGAISSAYNRSSPGIPQHTTTCVNTGYPYNAMPVAQAIVYTHYSHVTELCNRCSPRTQAHGGSVVPPAHEDNVQPERGRGGSEMFRYTDHHTTPTSLQSPEERYSFSNRLIYNLLTNTTVIA